MKLILATVAFCTLGLTAAFINKPDEKTAVADPSKPNIVVIMADDMGFSDIGCYGGEILWACTGKKSGLYSAGLRNFMEYQAARNLMPSSAGKVSRR